MNIDKLLPFVEKPSRYIGGEANAAQKDWNSCDVTVALAFPDVYEVGMSHLGLKILYALLQEEKGIAVERCFAPWPDMERLLKERRIPLASLESQRPLADFDIVGLSLQYELSFTNVLAMIDLGRIPLLAEKRSQGDPLVIAGGPCAFNPEPLSDFIDAFVIGEGEEPLVKLVGKTAEAKKGKATRKELLTDLAEIPGVYVPSVHEAGARIMKSAVADLNEWRLPRRPIIPLPLAVHDRITLEICRGCTSGCRFCQAGMIWRPVRERSPSVLREMAAAMLASTGYDELSLLALSAGDYTLIESLMTSLMDSYSSQRVALALPSLRVETLTARLIAEIKRVRKTSFTLAPEAGTQRLRNVINKGNSQEDLMATAESVFTAGWRSIKLYFMIGLPTEQEEDLAGIIDLAYKVLKIGGFRRQVTVSLSTFVPKPHTPFQWEGQAGLADIRERQDFFKRNLKHRNINLKWHDGRMSFLEGLISRGDRSIGKLLQEAFGRGCRFDGWSEQLDFAAWQASLAAADIDVDRCLGKRPLDDPLPWDYIDTGVAKDFLKEECRRALTEEKTNDCRYDVCTGCGVCRDGRGPVMASESEGTKEIVSGSLDFSPRPKSLRLRLTFSKEDRMRFLSHLESSAALTRAMARSGLRFIFSEGFHPHPKISFPYALPVGIESREEYLDITVESFEDPLETAIKGINEGLPRGLAITGGRILPEGAPSLAETIRSFRYRFILGPLPEASALLLEQRIAAFIAASEWPVRRERKGRETLKDLRPSVEALSFEPAEGIIHASLVFAPSGGVRPMEILTEIAGLDEKAAKEVLIVKDATICPPRE
ncbi:MAG: TIGR03960 family B12-binding radical SAM protein [Deltaproteobacteria bacterium]|nr:TIGR03960 family B12-binding radical SAM protein [Deltaproteobacteria bacterium]